MTAVAGRTIAGMSTERLAQIDRHLMQNYVEPGKFAGALTLVARKGEIAHFSAIGEMDGERGKATREDTIFRIYSMSKPITSVALMTLYEEGRFQLDDPVHKYIPSFEGLRVWEGGADPIWLTRHPDRPMTVRDLMSHQSGLTYGFMMRNSVDAAYRKLGIMGREGDQGLPDETLTEQIEKLSRVPLQFSPGTAWNYSVSTDVCGHLVELISGKPFDDYLTERIFKPLGMVDTAFYVPDEKLDRFAACYIPTPTGGRMLQDDPEKSAYRKPPKLLSGGGGLVSTATDYFRFCQMLLNGGRLDGVPILGRKTIELMTSNHLTGGGDLAAMAPSGIFAEVAFAGTGFGLGFSVLLDPAAAQIPGSRGQYAWGGAASTAFWVDPVEEVILVFMTQLLPSGTYPIRRELQVLVNAAIVD
ncbi:MAG: serine hydrolase domain-containing protein [Dehalococcoidia bacterium]